MNHSLRTYFIFVLLLYLFSISSSTAQSVDKMYARVDVEITKEKKPKRIYTKVAILSAFTGGDSVWIATLEKTLNQSIQYNNGAKAGKYLVSVAFITDIEGQIFDIHCINDPVGYGMEEQVVRAIKKGAKWVPARQNGQVRPYRTTSSTPGDSLKSVSFKVRFHLRDMDKDDAAVLKGYVIVIGYERAKALDGKRIRISGRVSIVHSPSEEKPGQPVAQVRQGPYKCILSPQIEVLD